MTHNAGRVTGSGTSGHMWKQLRSTDRMPSIVGS
jgi:hypothetical protein